MGNQACCSNDAGDKEISGVTARTDAFAETNVPSLPSQGQRAMTAEASQKASEDVNSGVMAWIQWTPEEGVPSFKSLRTYFPTAIPGSVVVKRTALSLKEYGFTPENTIYGQSLCPDEINCLKGGMAYSLMEYWGECFPMGGIGGAPFVGKTGFMAFSHHVPDDGNVLIFFGPHIAISESGELGKHLREGQTKESTACGAVLAAYSALTQVEGAGIRRSSMVDSDGCDMQQDWLKDHLGRRIDKIKNAKEPISALIYEAYECVKETMLSIVNNNFGNGKLVLVGGIQLNMPRPHEDHFQPLMFRMISKNGDVKDLLSEFDFKTAFYSEDLQERCFDLFSWLNMSPSPTSPCFAAMHRYFPACLPGEIIVRKMAEALRKFGLTPENTIYGQSLCPDEINCEKGGMAYSLTEYWGECFPMGGIGGAPFVGKTGFMAFSHHVPENGNVVVVFGPHIAVSESGELGKHKREGQRSESTACGAILAAYAALKDVNGAYVPRVIDSDDHDMQQDWLKNKFGERLDHIRSAKEPTLALIYEAYKCVEEKMLTIVNNNFGSGKLVLLGGIQINVPQPYKDHFQPIMFKVISKDGSQVDLLAELSLDHVKSYLKQSYTSCIRPKHLKKGAGGA
jgi:hypothetical protein